MYILYEGPGARSDNIHTIPEFLKIVHMVYMDSDAHWKFSITDIDTSVSYTVQWKQWILPDDFVFFSLEDWLDFTSSNAFE